MLSLHHSLVPLSGWALPLLFSATIAVEPLRERTLTFRPRPYTINVDPVFIEETRIKASKFRSSADNNVPEWFDGPPSSLIDSVAKYWVDEYDWSAMQAEINANFSHFITTVPPPGDHYNEPVDLHFIHQRSERKDAIPMLLLHGWPSTSLEWKRVIPGLVKPKNDSQPAFHVVAPDMPGFGFSPALNGSRVGVTRKEHATIFASLMEQLGYERYILYSTDLGTIVSMSLVVDYKEHIINHVSDFYITIPSDADQARFKANETSPEETAYINGSNVFFGTHIGYATVHSTYPLSLAHAMNDSPVGFLAWWYQLAGSVSDKPYSSQELVTNTLLLYIPGVYGNIRSYKELYTPNAFIPDEKFTVPTSIVQFGGVMHYPDMANWEFAPRDWVERTANVTYFSRHESGGHFPAFSEPELWLSEIRTIFA